MAYDLVLRRLTGGNYARVSGAAQGQGMSPGQVQYYQIVRAVPKEATQGDLVLALNRALVAFPKADTKTRRLALSLAQDPGVQLRTTPTGTYGIASVQRQLVLKTVGALWMGQGIADPRAAWATAPTARVEPLPPGAMPTPTGKAKPKLYGPSTKVDLSEKLAAASKPVRIATPRARRSAAAPVVVTAPVVTPTATPGAVASESTDNGMTKKLLIGGGVAALVGGVLLMGGKSKSGGRGFAKGFGKRAVA